MPDFLHIYLEKIPVKAVKHLGYELIERTKPFEGNYYFSIPVMELNNLRTNLLLDNIYLTQPKNPDGHWYDMEKI